MVVSGRRQAQGDRVIRRRAPRRIAIAVLAAIAFAIGAASAMADPTSVAVTDAGLDVVASPVDVAPAPEPAPVVPAADPTVAPVDATPPPPPDPALATVAPAPLPVDTATPVTVDPATTTTAAPVEPVPDQLSPELLAQVSTPATFTPSALAADAPPVVQPTRKTAETDAAEVAAKPTLPPPTGDKPPNAVSGAAKNGPRLVALVSSLVPVARKTADQTVTPPRQEAPATRASAVWDRFVWRNAAVGSDSSDLGTRALLAIIGVLPFAPVDGPDRNAPSSQLALLIPVLGLVAFLFATCLIVDPRRRGQHRYLAVALKPG